MKKRAIVLVGLCCLALGIGLVTGATEPKTLKPGSYYTPTAGDYYVTKEKVTTVPNTVEAWICLGDDLDNDSRGGVIVGNYDDTTDATFSVEVFSGKHPRALLIAEDGSAQSYVFNKVTLATGEYVHLTIVRDVTAEEIRCYVGGELQQTLALYGTQVTTIDDFFGVGGDLKDGNRTYFKGEINSVVLFDDVRTAEEIGVDMSAVSESEEGLIANWSFDIFTAGQATVADLKGSYTLARSVEWTDTFDVGTYDYTIALVGDTQWLNYYHSDSYDDLYQWLVDNKSEKKIKAVLGLGDITENNTEEEWNRADAAGTLLANNSIPYTMIVGNHDLYGNDKTGYNGAFPISEFNTKNYWGGSFAEDTILNSYYQLKMGDTEYLIFALEYGPRDEVLEWAGQIIGENSNKNVIITTHGYIHKNGEFVAVGDGASAPAPSQAYGYNDGEDVWEQLASKYENVSMVICGHASGNLYIQQKTGDNGNTVTEILHDATRLDTKDSDNGASGTVCLLHVKESEDGNHKIQPVLYSTIKGQYYKPSYQDVFELDALDATE